MPFIESTGSGEQRSYFTLADGTSGQIRPIRPDDDRTLIEIFNRLSPQTVYQRFFTALPSLTPALAHHLSNVDSVYRQALLAEVDGVSAGVARYECTEDPGLVELGLVVVDDWQNRGLGRILLRNILRAAEGNGIDRFCADVLAENRRMLHLLATEGQIQNWKTEAGVTTLLLSARRDPTEVNEHAKVEHIDFGNTDDCVRNVGV